MKKTRRKIDAAPKAKLALEALREQSTMADPGLRRGRICRNGTRSPRTRFYAWKKQRQEQAARAFDAGVGRDTEADREREIEKLPARSGS